MTTPNDNNPFRPTVGPRRQPQTPSAPSTPAFQAPPTTPTQPRFGAAGNGHGGSAPVQPRRRGSQAESPVGMPPTPQQNRPVPQQNHQPAPQQSYLPAPQPSHQPAPQAAGMMNQPQVKSDRSKVSALLLAFFLGGFGAHNFYLGYTTKAWWQLALSIFGVITSFFLIGIPIVMGVGIWVFVDFIMILLRSGSYGHDVDGRPLR
ncbi:NINE protein [Corynebacterium variabile]|uniref:Predicted membrane protein n=1 Tax=Corynebacterium variabile TaxID=1727 RepID=A0A0X2NPE7_9CORY|nr:TM2 domain-containing protein [Corynebacterium variabile]CUU66610.1 Predicted membrane protein [Corynebacterium variabile]